MRQNEIERISLSNANDRTIIKTNRPVRTFTVSPDTIITLTDKGFFEFYSTEDGLFRDFVPPFSTSAIVSLAFTSDYSQVLTCHEDGSVYKLREPSIIRASDELVTDEPDSDSDTAVKKIGQEYETSPSPVATNGAGLFSGYYNNAESEQKSGGGTNIVSSADAFSAAQNQPSEPQNGDTKYSDAQDTLPQSAPEDAGTGSFDASSDGSSVHQSQPAQAAPVPFDFRSSLRERFSACNAGASGLLLDKNSTYYQFGAALEFDWYTTQFTAPVYEGLGARIAAAFPADNYPVTYKTLDGSKQIAPPELFFAEFFVPLGVEMPLSTFISFFSELALELKVSLLMNPSVTSSEPAFSLGGRLRTGITISKVAIVLGAEYDSLWGFIPELSVMANFKLKRKGVQK